MTSPASRAPPVGVVIAVGGLLTSISLGARSTFGLFLDPVVDGVLDGVQQPFAIAIALQSIAWGLTQPIAGAISDRFGAAPVLAGGFVLYALALLLFSASDSGVAIVASVGLMTGVAVGAASFAVVLSAVGRVVPAERRTFALGLVSAIGSLGQFVLVPVVDRLLDTGSWRPVAVLLAVIVAIGVVAAPALRGTAAARSGVAGEDGRTLRTEFGRAIRSRPYLMVNAAFFVCGFHVTFIATYLPRHGDDLGHASAAAIALSLIGLFNVVGSLAAGWLGQRHSKTHLLAGIYGLRATVIAGYMLVPASGAVTIVFGALIGVLWLSTVPLTSAMVTEQFGTRHAGALFGVVFLSHQVGALAGALSGGSLYDATGSYDVVWWIAVALGVAAAAAHLSISDGPILPSPVAHAPGRRWAFGGASVVLVASALTVATVVHTDDAEAVAPAWCGPVRT